MKKLGIISLALVLALGALGAAYAPWTDEIEIIQTVETGSLEIGVYGRVNLDGDEKGFVDKNVELVGDIKFWKDWEWPEAEVVIPFHEKVVISIDNLYPCVYVNEDFLIGVGGTVPVHLFMTYEFDGEAELLRCMTFRWTIHFPDGTSVSGEGLEALAAALQDEQVHPCEIVHIELTKHLLQCEGRSQELSGTFTFTVKAYQYNWTP